MMTRRKVVAGAAALTTVAVASGAAAVPLRTPVSSGPLALQYADCDAIGLAELVRTRQVSPTELLDAAIAQAEAMNPRFNFMAHKMYDFSRAAIARGLPKGPFTGVPWLLKDLNADIARELTEDGSVFYKGTRPAVTSELVERHMRAGLVIFGKTTSPEFGLTATTESTLYGDTRNPWDPAYITGGSSGGSAAAIASGVLPAAHATDGGGSIRIPASCCGLFGLKPSRGRVPIGPGRTQKLGAFSVHHAITRSVRDSAAILDATHGIEVGSPYGAPAPDGTFLENLRRQPGRLRIALMLDPVTHSAVDPQVIAATRSAARLCESLGHHVEEAAPKLDAAALGRASFTMSGSVLAAHVAAHAKATGRDPADLLEPITQAFAQYGKTFTGADVAWADTAVQEATYAVGAFMTNYDVILSPTLGAPPLKLGRINLNTTIGLQEWGQRVSEFSPFTQLANWTGQPAMSVPLAMADEGLPIGVMFTGRYGDEALLYRLAGQLEQAVPWAGRRPQL